jgi:hypothetical protein
MIPGLKMPQIHFKDTDYCPEYINEFTFQPFDAHWIFLKLIDTPDFQIMNGGNENVFSVIISKQCGDWPMRVMDFFEYESDHHKNIIAAVEKQDLDLARTCSIGHHYRDPFLRTSESPVLVHSTPRRNYEFIIAQGCLKSWNFLKSQGQIQADTPIGEQLGDPQDYSDYVMFTHGGVAGEIVVNSMQQGHIVMDTHTLYQPGARFYLDAKKIAEDGLLVRDGVHVKVKDQLPLEKYLLWCATSGNVDMEGLPTTPHDFALQADKGFQSHFNYRLG